MTVEALASVPLNAYNLIPGAAFREPKTSASKVFIVTQVLYRHAGSERIGLLCRVRDEYITARFPQVTDDTKALGREAVGRYETFSLDFCDEVLLVGLSVNPDTWDDTDIGQEADLTD